MVASGPSSDARNPLGSTGVREELGDPQSDRAVLLPRIKAAPHVGCRLRPGLPALLETLRQTNRSREMALAKIHAVAPPRVQHASHPRESRIPSVEIRVRSPRCGTR